MSKVLSARNLRKEYPTGAAVVDISLDVEEGVCYGLLGPNGAGKSTTLEMLEGLLQPTSGEIRYRGRAMDARCRETIGILFQSSALPDFLTVRDNLRIFRGLYRHGVTIDSMVQDCHLEEILDRDPRLLSGGQRQRLLLAIALINDPDVVFLDEPTTGLDPQSRQTFWQLIRRIKARGKTVVLTTHYMDEANELCDQVAIVDHGRVICSGSPRELLAQHFRESVIQLPVEALDRCSVDLPAVRRGDLVEFSTYDMAGTLRQLLAANLPLEQLRIRQPTLDDLFLHLTGKELRA